MLPPGAARPTKTQTPTPPPSQLMVASYLNGGAPLRLLGGPGTEQRWQDGHVWTWPRSVTSRKAD